MHSGLIEYDGPTIIKLIFARMNPDSMVKITNLKNSLKVFNTGSYENIIPNMLDDIDRIYSEILADRGTHDRYIEDLLVAMETCKQDK